MSPFLREEWKMSPHPSFFPFHSSIREEPRGGNVGLWKVRFSLFHLSSPRLTLPVHSVRAQVHDLWGCQLLDTFPIRKQSPQRRGSWKHRMQNPSQIPCSDHDGAWSSDGSEQWVLCNRRPYETLRVRISEVLRLSERPVTSWILNFLFKVTLTYVPHKVVSSIKWDR